MKVLVLGGYGNFGARICRALAGHPGIDLVVAGRDLGKAQGFARELPAAAASLDVGAPGLAASIASLQAGLVIHTAGPFQSQDYGVAEAAAAAGAHYIDLADGRRFVCGFASALDSGFRRAGRCAVAGASTVPALSSAVIDALRPRFAQLDAIDICIAPAQQAPRGEATLAAVLSYCGAPVQVWEQGRWHARDGWASPSVVRFARMKPRPAALCDIPDLELLPARYPGVQDVAFRAALEVTAAQRAFAVLAWMRRHSLVRHPERLAGLMHRFGAVFDAWGTPVGGMVVRLRGLDGAGRPLRLAWHITAGAHHGPEIPCMPAILLARRMADGWQPPAGAMPCMGLLELAQFEPEFARWGMVTDLVEEACGGA